MVGADLEHLPEQREWGGGKRDADERATWGRPFVPRRAGEHEGGTDDERGAAGEDEQDERGVRSVDAWNGGQSRHGRCQRSDAESGASLRHTGLSSSRTRSAAASGT